MPEVKGIKIIATIGSTGADWPQEEIDAITKFFEERGYTNIASGSGDALEHSGTRWWQVSYERTDE